MSEQPTVPAGVSAETYNAWLSGVTLGAIEVVRVHAERRRGGVAPQTEYGLGVGWTSEGGRIFWRYDVTAHLTDDASTDFGEVQVSVVLSVEHERADVDPDCVELFGTTSGALMTHPYLREAVATSALRVGFPGVMMPMMTTLDPAEQAEQAGTVADSTA